jgi:hypothetical protein
LTHDLWRREVIVLTQRVLVTVIDLTQAVVAFERASQ